MPRRAFSTFKAEIKDGGPFGVSTGLFESDSSVVSSGASPELLIRNLRGLNAIAIEFENWPPCCGGDVLKFGRRREAVAEVEVTAIGSGNRFVLKLWSLFWGVLLVWHSHLAHLAHLALWWR